MAVGKETAEIHVSETCDFMFVFDQNNFQQNNGRCFYAYEMRKNLKNLIW